MSSNNVDERVVKMSFDNAQFEAGVKQTLTSLESLKRSLNFNNSLTGIQALSSAFNSFSLANITSQLDQVTSRFSTLGIVGMTAIENITNKVLNFTTSKIQSTIGQITSGGWARASSIAQSRFTLQGLLNDEEKVQEAFDSASNAVDGTAYSLNSAVAAASQLAASGIDVGEEMENTLKGIAGTAAMTGDSFDSIANIFTTVAGNGRLMGMQLTQLSSHGLNAAATIAEYLGTTEAEVRDMTTKGQISFETFSNAMQSAFGEHAKDANKTFSGSMDNIKSALSRIGAIFSSGIIENDDLINALNDVRITINNIKNAMLPLEDKFKNLVSSASKLFSSILGDVKFDTFENFVDCVGKAMDYVSTLNKKWTDLNEKFKESVLGIVAEEAEEAAEDIYAASDKIQAAWDIWNNNAYGSGAARKAALEEQFGSEGANIIQTLVNQIAKGNTDIAHYAINDLIEVEEAVEEVNGSLEDTEDKVKHVEPPLIPLVSIMKAFGHFADGAKTIFDNMKTTVSKLASTFKKVFSWHDLIQDISDYGDMFSNFLSNFEMTEERSQKLEVVFTGLWSAIDLLRQIIKSVVGGITKSFGPALSVIYDIVLSLLANIGILITRLKEWYEENDLLKSIFEFLGNTLKNVILFATNFFNELSNMSVISTIKDKLKDLAELISEKLTPFFGDAKDKINEFFGEMNGEDSTKITDVVGDINEVLETLIGYIDDGKGKLEDFFGYISDKFGKLFGIKETLDQVTGGVTDLNDATAGTSVQKASLFANIPYFDKIMEFAKSFGSGLLERIKNIKAYQVVLTGFGASLIILALNINSFISSIKNSFKSFGEIGNAIKGVFTSISGIFNQIKKNIAMNSTLILITKITILIGVLAAAIIGLALVDTKKMLIAAGVLTTIIGLIVTMTMVFNSFMKKAEWGSLIKFQDMVRPLSTLFISLSASVLLIANALAKLSEVETEGIWIKFAVLASITAVVAAMAIAISRFAPQIASGGISLIGYAAAVYILVKALIQLNSVDVEAIKGKLLVLIGIIVTVGLVAATATKLAGINASSGFGLLAVIASLILMEVALNYIVESGVDLDAIKNNLGKFITVFATLALIIVAVKILGNSSTKVLGNVILLIAITMSLKTIASILVELAQAARSGGIITGIMALYAIFGGVFAILYIINMNATSISKASGVLLSIAGTIAIIAIVASLIGNIPITQLLKGIGSIIVIMAALGTFMVLVSRLSEEQIDYKPIAAMSLAIIAMGTMLALISSIAKDNPESLIIAAISLGLSLISLAVAYTLASKESGKVQIGALLTLISAIVVIGGVLAGLTFLQTKGGSIIKSMFAIIGILAAITAAYWIIAKNDLTVDAKSLGGLSVLVGSLINIAFAIQLLNQAQTNGSLLKSVIAIIAILAALVIGLKVLNNVDKLNWATVASLGVLVISLLVIAASLKELLDGEYNWGSMIIAAVSLSIVMAVMVGSLALLSKIGSSGPMAMIGMLIAAAALTVTLLAFSVAMNAFATSIKILVECIKQLATIDYSAIDILVLVELCGVVALLGIASGIASGGVLMLSAGLAIIAASMLVASVAIAIMTPQLIALMAAFTAMTLVGDKVSAGMDAITNSIVNAIVKIAIGLAEGIASFITTIAAKAPAITVAINVILASILVSIASSIVTINTVIINGLINLLTMLEQKLPTLSEKITKIIEIILKAIADHSMKFGYYGALITMNFIAGMILGLASGIKPLLSAIGMFVLKFINGIGDAVYEYSDRIVASMQYLADVMYNSLLKALAATVPGVGALIGGEIEESNKRIEDWQEKRYEDIGETSTDALADSMLDGADKVEDAGESVVDSATDHSEVASKNAKSTSSSFIDSMSSAFNTGSGSLTSYVTDKLGGALGDVDLSGSASEMMGTFFNGANASVETETIDVSHVPSDVVNDLKEQGWELEEGGKTMTRSIQTGMTEEDIDISSLTEQMNAQLPTGEDGYESGENVKEEWVNGMTSATEEEKARIYHTYSTYADQADQGARDALDINSPSKKAMKLRDSWVEGFVKVDSQLSKQISDTYGDYANTSLVAAANVMSSISKVMQDESIDWNPTLTPVIDDSQLQNGSNLLTATFGNSALNLAADTALSVKDNEASNLATQVAELSAQVKKLADTDYSKMLDGVSINVDASTNVDGTPLRKMASNYTIKQIDAQQSNYNMSRGARA